MPAGCLAQQPVLDVTFSKSQLAAARSVLDRHLGDACRVELAFLGGSLAVGLGHATSDVDLYTVGDPHPHDCSVFSEGGIVVRVRTTKAHVLDDLLRLGERYQLTDGRHPQATASWDDLYGLVNLATGRVLHASPEWQRRLAALRTDAVQELLITRHAAAGASAASNAFGALTSGDLYTAHSASELALVSACEAALCAQGDIYFGRTFLLRRLARSAMGPTCREHLARLLSFTGPVTDPSDSCRVRRDVEERLLVANMLLASVALDHGQRDGDGVTHFEPARHPTQGPRRSPYFVPVRYADGYTLTGASGTYDVSEAMLRLWRWLDGGRLDDLVRVLARHERALAELSLDEIDRGVRALQRIGAVDFAPSRPGTPQLGVSASSAGVVREGALSLAPSARAPLSES